MWGEEVERGGSRGHKRGAVECEREIGWQDPSFAPAQLASTRIISRRAVLVVIARSSGPVILVEK